MKIPKQASMNIRRNRARMKRDIINRRNAIQSQISMLNSDKNILRKLGNMTLRPLKRRIQYNETKLQRMRKRKTIQTLKKIKRKLRRLRRNR